MYQVINLVYLLLQGLIIAIFIRAILSWFMQLGKDPLTRLLLDVTEPLLRPIRELMGRLLPNMFMDFSPFVAILLLQLLAGMVANAARGYG